ncbi:hypothetical protein Zmor_002882 [Zophobas morio]|uniref:Uncharacterized protein n=1 Tax=Zophobas morio TaxID=2755281 RepID=A0AA38HN43_9CUCU|nr:hypothetical protein Zmor_002882 [Zophobas morio]
MVNFSNSEGDDMVMLYDVARTERKLQAEEQILERVEEEPEISTRRQCRTVVGRFWGLNPKIALWIYTALVRQSFLRILANMLRRAETCIASQGPHFQLLL